MATHPKTAKTAPTAPTNLDNEELVNMTPTKKKAGDAIKEASRETEASTARKRVVAAEAKKREEERIAAEKARIAEEPGRLRREMYARRGQVPPPKSPPKT